MHEVPHFHGQDDLAETRPWKGDAVQTAATQILKTINRTKTQKK
jgi:hypothetical protein